MLWRSRPELDAARLARRNEREREVAVDVRVHARQRELQWCNPASGAPGKERHPCPRRKRRAVHVGIEGLEEEVREDDVESLEKGLVGERASGQLGRDSLRHLS